VRGNRLAERWPGGRGRRPGGRPSGRRFGGLLWERSFRLLWIGETVSQLGNAMAVVGVPLAAVIVLHASTFAVGVLTAAAWLPWLVIGLPAGAWVDRLPTRQVMIVCDAVSAVLYASVPAAAWIGVLTTGQLIAVQLLGGAASVLFMTAYQVYLPSLVAPGQLIEGNTKMQGSASAAAFAGPSLAGLVAQLLGAVTALLCNAVSFVVSAACLLGTRGWGGADGRRDSGGADGTRDSGGDRGPRRSRGTGPQGTETETGAVRRDGLRREIADGLLLVLRDAYLRQLSMFWAAANLALTGYTALLVVFLVRVIGLTPGPVGLLSAVPGLGGILGALITGRITARFGTARGLLLSTLCGMPFGLLIPLTGPGLRLAFYVAGSLLAFTGMAIGNIVIAAFRQSYAPPGMCGRVTATMRFLIFGTSPVGALLGGSLGTWLGVRAALWLLLGALALSGALLLTRALAAGRDLPEALLRTSALGSGRDLPRALHAPALSCGPDLPGSPRVSDRGHAVPPPAPAAEGPMAGPPPAPQPQPDPRGSW
jgi:MFS family permease